MTTSPSSSHESPYRDQLVLKGGILLYLLTGAWNRPTEDLDLLVLRIPGESLEQVLREILVIDLGDRLDFQADRMTSEEIREDTGYPCRRFSVPFRFGARFAQVIKLDLSFGDPVTPGPRLIEFQPMLEGFQGGLVMGYPIETFIAEKVETLLVRGLATTRAKDLFDLWVIARVGSQLRLTALAEALRATADHRAELAGRADSVLTREASALQASYGLDAALTRIWAAYTSSKKLVAPPHAEVVAEVQAFIRPVVDQCLAPEHQHDQGLIPIYILFHCCRERLLHKFQSDGVLATGESPGIQVPVGYFPPVFKRNKSTHVPLPNTGSPARLPGFSSRSGFHPFTHSGSFDGVCGITLLVYQGH